jgi:hypothetical protein
MSSSVQRAVAPGRSPDDVRVSATGREDLENRQCRRLQLADLVNAGSWYRAVDDLRSDASRAIDLAWKRYHNRIGRFHPEREATTGAAELKLRHYLCSRNLVEAQGQLP